MLVHIATNVFGNSLLHSVYASAIGMLWMLFALWTLIEFAPGRMQLATSSMPPMHGPVRVVVFKAARWHAKQLFLTVENRVWMWLNSQVLFGA